MTKSDFLIIVWWAIFASLLFFAFPALLAIAFAAPMGALCVLMAVDLNRVSRRRDAMEYARTLPLETQRALGVK